MSPASGGLHVRTASAPPPRPGGREPRARAPRKSRGCKGGIETRLFKGSRTVVDIRLKGNDEDVLKAYLEPAVADSIVGDAVWVSWPTSRASVLAR